MLRLLLMGSPPFCSHEKGWFVIPNPEKPRLAKPDIERRERE